MTLQTIPFANLAGLLFTSLTSVVLPLVLWVLACKKWQEKPNSLIAGSGGFVIFALILEQSVNSIVLNNTAIQETPWLLYLYGGAVAALFEELGRFFMMKVAMRKNLDAPNAVLYGLGHGGIESVMVVGMTYVNNFIIAVMVQSGKMAESLATLEQAEAEQTVRNLEPMWTLTADPVLPARRGAGPGPGHAGGLLAAGVPEREGQENRLPGPVPAVPFSDDLPIQPGGSLPGRHCGRGVQSGTDGGHLRPGLEAGVAAGKWG